MTETMQDRLRYGAANIHSIGPARAADLLSEAAACFDHDAKVEANMAKQVAQRRAFLERAVCHPGPPASEHEGYDPEAPLSELEAAVLERMDLELKAERELHAIRTQVLGEAFTAKVSLLEAVTQVCVDAGMARLLGRQLDEIAALVGPAEPPDAARDTSWKAPDPVDLVRGLVADLAAIRNVLEEALGRTPDPARSTVRVARDAAEHLRAARTYRANMEDPPAELEPHELTTHGRGARPPHPKAAEFSGPRDLDGMGSQDAVAAHIKAHGGDPDAATVAQIADALNATDPNFTYKPNAASNGLDSTPVRRAGAGGSIRIVDGDTETRPALGLTLSRLHRTMAEASAEHEGDDATRRMYRPGSPIPKRAPADCHPAEYMTPEEEAAEQAERFQGLEDSDRD